MVWLGCGWQTNEVQTIGKAHPKKTRTSENLEKIHRVTIIDIILWSVHISGCMNIRFNALVSAKFAPSDLKVEALEGPNFAYEEVAMLAFFGLEQRKALKCHLRCPTTPGSSQFLIFWQFILSDVFLPNQHICSKYRAPADVDYWIPSSTVTNSHCWMNEWTNLQLFSHSL